MPLWTEPVGALQDARHHVGRHPGGEVAEDAPAVPEAGQGAARGQVVEQLLDHERVAAAVRAQPVHDLRRHLLGRNVQAGRGEPVHVVAAERGEVEDPGAAPAGRRAGQFERGSGLGAHGAQQQHRQPVEVVHEVLDHGQRLGVRLVQVLQDHHAAAAGTGQREYPQDRFGQYDQRLGPVRGRCGPPLRDQPAERGPVRHQVRMFERPVGAEQAEQRLRDGPERDRRAQHAAAPAQHPQAAVERAADQLGRQPGLADAGLTDEEARAAPPPARTVQCRVQRRAFVLAPDQGACPPRHAGQATPSAVIGKRSVDLYNARSCPLGQPLRCTSL